MTSIAVLGGGLSGLSSAFHLARRFPNHQITILEKQANLGGWVKSHRVNLSPNDSVLLEGGPRTLRPNGKSVLELINLLNLQDQLITVSKSSPAARSRYLYIPPSSSSSPFSISGLQKIPSSPNDFLHSPLTRLLIPSVLKEAFTSRNRPTGITDESFDALLTRRFGPDFARVLGSALVHGIYASDSRQLSVQSAFPSLWELEDAGRGSVARGGVVLMLKEMMRAKLNSKTKLKEEEDYDLGNVPELMRGVSVYSFKDGMQTLIKALQADLQKRPNVKIICNTDVRAITKLQPGTFEISHSHQTLYTTHLISSLSPSTLKPLLRPSPFLPIPPHPTTQLMQTNPLSSVQVLNLVFPCAPKDVHPEGFGYLVLRPDEGYESWVERGHHPVLGMVFDSCSLGAQDWDTDGGEGYYENGKWTKVTVMLGGPYGMPEAIPLAPSPSISASPSRQPLPTQLQSLLSTLSTHLSRPLPAPVYWKTWNNHRCIPTLLPGHQERVQQLRELIEGDDRKGKSGIKIVGAGVDGVSVPDCVRSGRRAAREL
ncbi:hypothetical protein BJ165DRAFT_1365252 [Panaeolus papilionaceus]|nr:hypothetical protein BJ165DRAFT_1365252 [Panaeolus papilionaceus]